MAARAHSLQRREGTRGDGSAEGLDLWIGECARTVGDGDTCLLASSRARPRWRPRAETIGFHRGRRWSATRADGRWMMIGWATNVGSAARACACAGVRSDRKTNEVLSPLDM